MDMWKSTESSLKKLEPKALEVSFYKFYKDRVWLFKDGVRPAASIPYFKTSLNYSGRVLCFVNFRHVLYT